MSRAFFPKAVPERPIVCVQGLGFVGAAMALAVSMARDADGPLFNVIGLDMDTPRGRDRIAAINAHRFPFLTPDRMIAEGMLRAKAQGNLVATSDPAALGEAATIVVDVHMDVGKVGDSGPKADFSGFETAIATIGDRAPPEALVIVETTVPPGTCKNVVRPILRERAHDRGLRSDAFFLAHSYERVMPGPDYLNSVINYWRVYAGHDEASADRCQQFLEAVINTHDYPLRRLSSTNASEMAKVLENSYRAANIAFIEEWSQFAEAAEVDLFQVIEAIRDRPTHRDIRQPGFGVGGYCLTKDPLFPSAATATFWPESNLAFPFCNMSMGINSRMPLRNLDRIEGLLGGLSGMRLMVLGIAYRSEVDDTRYSPAEVFVREARRRGAEVVCHDPYVRYWQEMAIEIGSALPDPNAINAVVMAVPHNAYRTLDIAAWLGTSRPLVYDCDNVISNGMRASLREQGITVESTGRGLGL